MVRCLTFRLDIVTIIALASNLILCRNGAGNNILEKIYEQIDWFGSSIGRRSGTCGLRRRSNSPCGRAKNSRSKTGESEMLRRVVKGQE
jgi:hypothetical protein